MVYVLGCGVEGLLPGQDTSVPGVNKGSTEELWLVFDKNTGQYHLYANAAPDPKDLSSDTPKDLPSRPGKQGTAFGTSL